MINGGELIGSGGQAIVRQAAIADDDLPESVAVL